MDWLKTLAPTVATALLGPLGGAAVAAIGEIIGIDAPTQDKINDAFRSGQLTPEQLTAIKQLELQYQDDEKERGFKYAELAYKDRDSARQANVAGGLSNKLFAMSLILLAIALGTEAVVLFKGYPSGIPEVAIGRILGLFDSIAMMVLSYYYGTTSGSAHKNELLAQSSPK